MRAFSSLISYLFHPLLFPTYAALLILNTNPTRYGHFGHPVHFQWLIIVFALTFLFPLIWMVMMKRLDMIDSFHMEDAKQRIIPFVATATFYMWTTWMFKSSSVVTVTPRIPANAFLFFMMAGASLSIFLGFIANNFTKVSLHTIAAGNLLGLMLPLIRISPYDLRLLLPAVILLAGLIGSARLALKAHEPREVYFGYFIGFTGQFLAFSVVPLFVQDRYLLFN